MKFRNAVVGAVDYLHKNKELESMLHKLIGKLKERFPTITDKFFAEVEKVAKSRPDIIQKVREYIIKYSHEDESTYKKAFELLLNAAKVNPDFSAHLLIHLLKVDEIACSGGGSYSSGTSGEMKMADEPTSQAGWEPAGLSDEQPREQALNPIEEVANGEAPGEVGPEAETGIGNPSIQSPEPVTEINRTAVDNSVAGAPEPVSDPEKTVTASAPDISPEPSVDFSVPTHKKSKYSRPSRG